MNKQLFFHIAAACFLSVQFSVFASFKIYVSEPSDNQVEIIDSESHASTGTINAGTTLRFLACTPDGMEIYVANFGSGTLFAINTATDQVITIPVGTNPYAPFISADGSRVL